KCQSFLSVSPVSSSTTNASSPAVDEQQQQQQQACGRDERWPGVGRAGSGGCRCGTGATGGGAVVPCATSDAAVLAPKRHPMDSGCVKLDKDGVRTQRHGTLGVVRAGFRPDRITTTLIDHIAVN
uniref:PPM-type phosphatase domain-containing protein n=1 Tax=Globodera pallida TaxID=36090 RepID=A0A183CC70_GLOPA